MGLDRLSQLVPLWLVLSMSCAAPAARGPSERDCRAPDSSNTAAVKHAYCLLLDYAPAPEMLHKWQADLEQFRVSRRQLLVHLFLSAEGQRVWRSVSDDELVTRLHRQLLGPQEDTRAIARSREWLEQGRPRRAVLRDLVTGSEFARRHPVFGLQPTARVSCPQLADVRNTARDAAPVLQRCVDTAPAGAELALPAGRYTLRSTLRLVKALVLRTDGLTITDPRCAASDRHGCAELVAAVEFAGGPLLLVDTDSSGVVIDHIVMNGNRMARTDSEARCKQNPSAFGPVFAGNGIRNLTLINSVAKNALCSTGIGIVGDAEVTRNTVVANGKHTEGGLWADGMILMLHDSAVTNNELRDNTDIDLIFFGCPNCDVHDNRIRHGDGDDYYQSASFAALMIHAGPDGSGDYTGADVAGNDIDCGTKAACGFGLLLGADPWYKAKLFGGSYHHNVIRNAHQGLNVNGATGLITVYANVVESSGNKPNAACKRKENVPVRTSAYNIAPSSRPFVDLSNDPMRSQYTALDFKDCLLNSHNARSCRDLHGVPADVPCKDQQQAGIAYDTAYCCRP